MLAKQLFGSFCSVCSVQSRVRKKDDAGDTHTVYVDFTSATTKKGDVRPFGYPALLTLGEFVTDGQKVLGWRGHVEVLELVVIAASSGKNEGYRRKR